MQNDDLDTLRKVRDNLKALMPFVLVQGDAVHRVNPGSRQVVNANCAWAVSNGERSAHKVRALVDNLDNSYEALDALIARLSSEKLVSSQCEQARMEQNTGGDETSAVKAIQDWGSDNGYTFVHSEACDLLNRIRAHFNAAAKDIK